MCSDRRAAPVPFRAHGLRTDFVLSERSRTPARALVRAQDFQLLKRTARTLESRFILRRSASGAALDGGAGGDGGRQGGGGGASGGGATEGFASTQTEAGAAAASVAAAAAAAAAMRAAELGAHAVVCAGAAAAPSAIASVGASSSVALAWPPAAGTSLLHSALPRASDPGAGGAAAAAAGVGDAMDLSCVM